MGYFFGELVAKIGVDYWRGKVETNQISQIVTYTLMPRALPGNGFKMFSAYIEY